MAQVEKDALTGTDTTGHEWDGIKELNTPLPKWWLYTYYATIIWAIGYFVVYPAWPTLNSYTPGLFGYSSRQVLDQQMQQVKADRAPMDNKLTVASIGQIQDDAELRAYAMAGGKFIFAENCAPCHGAGGQGAPGYPVLADDDWIWGGSAEAIEYSIRYGIRSDHEDARVAVMPAFGRDELLNSNVIEALADHVLALSGQGGGMSPMSMSVFAEQCAICHGMDAKGMAELGAPNLTDAITLHISDRASIVAHITNPTHGVMPAWTTRLDDPAIKQVTTYVYSLGGGQ